MEAIFRVGERDEMGEEESERRDWQGLMTLYAVMVGLRDGRPIL